MSFLASFFIAAAILAITPGPGIAYVVARTAAGGRREGLASCFGTAIGGMLHVVAAALGLSLLVAQSALASNVVKYVGAVYLIYLGIRLLLRKDQTQAIEPLAIQGARHALFVAVFAPDRLLTSSTTHARRLSQVSGVTMLGLGAFLALARREA